MHELPLVLFTLLAQLSVGAFVILGIVNLVDAAKHSTKVVDRVGDPALYALGPAMVLGLAASTLHLGAPMNALNAFRHLGSSWLSREVAFGSLFAAFGFLFALLQWRHWGSRVLRQVLAVITALLGVGLLVSMIMVYMQPTVPAWNRWTTPAQFVLTTLLLGALAVGAALAGARALGTPTHLLFGGREELDADESRQVDELITSALRWIGVAAMVLLPLQLLVMLFASQQPDVPGAPIIELNVMALAVRAILLIIGAGLLGIFMYTRAMEQAKPSTLFWVVAAALVLVFFAEFLGRIAFYDSMLRVGM